MVLVRVVDVFGIVVDVEVVVVINVVVDSISSCTSILFSTASLSSKKIKLSGFKVWDA